MSFGKFVAILAQTIWPNPFIIIFDGLPFLQLNLLKFSKGSAFQKRFYSKDLRLQLVIWHRSIEKFSGLIWIYELACILMQSAADIVQILNFKAYAGQKLTVYLVP